MHVDITGDDDVDEPSYPGKPSSPVDPAESQRHTTEVKSSVQSMAAGKSSDPAASSAASGDESEPLTISDGPSDTRHPSETDGSMKGSGKCFLHNVQCLDCD